MRIAMVSTPFIAVPPEGYGGTELVIHELVEGLVARGHEVALFATGDSRTSGELRYLFPAAQWPPAHRGELNHVSWALAQVRTEAFDVVHVHSASALAVHRLLGSVPLAYTLHHERDEDLSDFYRWFAEPYYVAISAAQAAREIPLDRLEVIHHGLDPSSFELRERPDAHVAFIGRFAEVKGAHTAIDVAERARVPIHVAGEIHEVDGDFGEREVLPRLEKPHVTFLGSIGMAGKVPLYRDARALLAPIQWEEPFGLVFIEAMLSGCPVVAFPRGSVPEVVEEGVTGFVVESAEGMAELIRRGGPLDSFDRARCRRRAIERFSRDTMVENHERLYARMRAESRERAA